MSSEEINDDDDEDLGKGGCEDLHGDWGWGKARNIHEGIGCGEGAQGSCFYFLNARAWRNGLLAAPVYDKHCRRVVAVEGWKLEECVLKRSGEICEAT